MKKYMKYLIMIFLAVVFVGIFSACAPEKEEEPKQLATPTGLTLYEYEVTWDEVDKAKTYAVVVDEGVEKWVKYNFYEIEDYPEEKTFVIKVKAVGDGVKYIDSDWAEYTYVYETPNPNLTYTLLNDGSGYEVGRKNVNPNQGLKGRVVIPDFYNGLPVKKIADEAFYWNVLGQDPFTGNGCNTSMTSVRLPAYLETIGKKAFRNCVALEEIDIPEGVNYIEAGAFESCKKISAVTFPEMILEIGANAFRNTDLKEVTIPNTVKTMEGGVFNSCKNLKKVILGEGVTAIEENAFGKCANLEEITLPMSVKKIGDFAFTTCSSLKKLPIHENIQSIGEGAYMKCDALTEAFIPAGVKSIGVCPFKECASLKGITVAENNEHYYSIDGNLYAAEGLLVQYVPKEGETVFELPQGTTAIGAYAFFKCDNLIEVTIPEGVTSIGEYAFNQCMNLTKATIPEGVTSIGEYAFSRCMNLTKATIPEGVTSIGGYVFEFCNLTEVTIPEGVTSIGERAFCNCKSLNKLELPNTLVSIGQSAFLGCDLVEVTIPDSVANIEKSAFSGNERLTSISFGAGAYFKSGVSVCGYSKNLKNITVSEENEHYRTIDGNLYTKDGTVLLQYANGKEDTFFKVPDGVTKIASYAFEGNQHLTGIEIPKSVTLIASRLISEGVDGKVYYCGTIEEYIATCKVTAYWLGGLLYCYSETPTTLGNVWHYDEKGEIVIW